MDPSNNQLLILAGVAIIGYCIFTYFNSLAWKLRHIPTAGASFGFTLNTKVNIDEGVRQWPRQFFKVLNLLDLNVVVAEATMVEELRRAPESVLSLDAFVTEAIQVDYTIGQLDEHQIPIIQNNLTRGLADLVPALCDEATRVLAECIPATNEWTSIKASSASKNIVVGVVSRALVDIPLCRNPEYLRLAVQFIEEVFKTSFILRLAPKILRPLLNYLVSPLPRRIDEAARLMMPFIQRRKEESEKKEAGSTCYLSWIMDAGRFHEEDANRQIAAALFRINFASTHSTSVALIHAIFYLATFPEYLQPLREEVEGVVAREGWFKTGLDQMHKIDSFIKESQRLRPIGKLLLARTALADFAFSDGTIIPKGTNVAVLVDQTHLSEEIFENPTTFDGFRFAKMKKANPGSDKRFDMVSTGLHSLAFGHGKRSCPGRFFAASMLKVILAQLVVAYDIGLDHEGVRPQDKWAGSTCIPDPTAEVLFRKRRA